MRKLPYQHAPAGLRRVPGSPGLTLRRTSSLAEILLRDKPTPKMFKNLLVPFVFGLAVAHTARADAGDTCSTHTDCVVSSGYASANPWASSEEFCYNTGTYNGVTVGACSDCFWCRLKDREECKLPRHITRIAMTAMDIETIAEGVLAAEKAHV